MISISNEVYQALQLLLEQQKQVINEVNYDYADGFYDGLEVVMAAIESRSPELTTIKNGEVLM